MHIINIIVIFSPLLVNQDNTDFTSNPRLVRLSELYNEIGLPSSRDLNNVILFEKNGVKKLGFEFQKKSILFSCCYCGPFIIKLKPIDIKTINCANEFLEYVSNRDYTKATNNNNQLYSPQAPLSGGEALYDFTLSDDLIFCCHIYMTKNYGIANKFFSRLASYDQKFLEKELLRIGYYFWRRQIFNYAFSLSEILAGLKKIKNLSKFYSDQLEADLVLIENALQKKEVKNTAKLIEKELNKYNRLNPFIRDNYLHERNFQNQTVNPINNPFYFEILPIQSRFEFHEVLRNGQKSAEILSEYLQDNTITRFYRPEFELYGSRAFVTMSSIAKIALSEYESPEDSERRLNFIKSADYPKYFESLVSKISRISEKEYFKKNVFIGNLVNISKKFYIFKDFLHDNRSLMLDIFQKVVETNDSNFFGTNSDSSNMLYYSLMFETIYSCPNFDNKKKSFLYAFENGNLYCKIVAIKYLSLIDGFIDRDKIKKTKLLLKNYQKIDSKEFMIKEIFFLEIVLSGNCDFIVKVNEFRNKTVDEKVEFLVWISKNKRGFSYSKNIVKFIVYSFFCTYFDWNKNFDNNIIKGKYIEEEIDDYRSFYFYFIKDFFGYNEFGSWSKEDDWLIFWFFVFEFFKNEFNISNFQ